MDGAEVKCGLCESGTFCVIHDPPRTWTVYDECLLATDAIWDDRDAYISAVLDRLDIDPKQLWSEYRRRL